MKILKILLILFLSSAAVFFFFIHYAAKILPEEKIYTAVNDTLREKSGLTFTYKQYFVSPSRGIVFKDVVIYANGRYLLNTETIAIVYKIYFTFKNPLFAHIIIRGSHLEGETAVKYLSVLRNITAQAQKKKTPTPSDKGKAASIKKMKTIKKKFLDIFINNIVVSITDFYVKYGSETAGLDGRIKPDDFFTIRMQHDLFTADLSGTTLEKEFDYIIKTGKKLRNTFSIHAKGCGRLMGEILQLSITDGTISFGKEITSKLPFPLPSAVIKGKISAGSDFVFSGTIHSSNSEPGKKNIMNTHPAFSTSLRIITGKSSAEQELNILKMDFSNIHTSSFSVGSGEVKGKITPSKKNLTLTLKDSTYTVSYNAVLSMPYIHAAAKNDAIVIKPFTVHKYTEKEKETFSVTAEGNTAAGNALVTVTGSKINMDTFLKNAASIKKNQTRTPFSKINCRYNVNEITYGAFLLENAEGGLTIFPDRIKFNDTSFIWKSNQVHCNGNYVFQGKSIIFNYSCPAFNIDTLNFFTVKLYDISGSVQAGGIVTATPAGLETVQIQFTNRNALIAKGLELQKGIWGSPLFQSTKSLLDTFSYVSGSLLLDFRGKRLEQGELMRYELTNAKVYSGEFESTINGRITELREKREKSSYLYNLSVDLVFSPYFKSKYVAQKTILSSAAETGKEEERHRLQKWGSVFNLSFFVNNESGKFVYGINKKTPTETTNTTEELPGTTEK